jgi:hypothetical protein
MGHLRFAPRIQSVFHLHHVPSPRVARPLPCVSHRGTTPEALARGSGAASAQLPNCVHAAQSAALDRLICLDFQRHGSGTKRGRSVVASEVAQAAGPAGPCEAVGAQAAQGTLRGLGYPAGRCGDFFRCSGRRGDFRRVSSPNSSEPTSAETPIAMARSGRDSRRPLRPRLGRRIAC